MERNSERIWLIFGDYSCLLDLNNFLNKKSRGCVDKDFDILACLKFNSSGLPILLISACDVLAPITTESCESACSSAGRVLDDFTLTPMIVGAHLKAQDWICRIKASDGVKVK